MNLSMKQKHTHRHREQTGSYQEGGGLRDGLGVWDQQMQTRIYRMDKQQFPLYSKGKSIQYPVINNSGKVYEKECMYIYIYITESLCCTAEINTAL